MGVMMAPVDGSGSWPACRQTVENRAFGGSFTTSSTLHGLISPSPRSMKHALLRTLPGRAIVIGAAVKLIVFVLTLATQPPGFVRLAGHGRVGLSGGGRRVLPRARARPRAAPAALACTAKTHHFVHLHRLHPGDPHRGVLPARRTAAVFELQLVPAADEAPVACRTRTGHRLHDRRRDPACGRGEVCPQSPADARPPRRRNSRAHRSRWCPWIGLVRAPMPRS